jgi:hypothetical protein
MTREFSYVSRGKIATAPDKAKAYVGRKAGSRDFHRAALAKIGKELLVERSPSVNIRGVNAFVNHGRWIAQCECGGAEVVDPEDPFFLCLSCLNAEFKERMRLVRFPAGRGLVEAALMARKDPRTRNWAVGEPVERLREETERHER